MTMTGIESEDSGSAYTEGDTITIGTSVDVTLCFFVVRGLPLYASDRAGITVRDNVAPLVDNIIGHSAVVWGIDDIGQEYAITVYFSEKVLVNKKGAAGPRLKLNSADDRYISTPRPRHPSKE